MVELVSQAITLPEEGESVKWWQLAYSRTVEDFADGAKSGSTLFIGTTDEDFTPNTNSNLIIGQDVDRIFGPLINNKWDPVELGIASETDAADLTKQFTIDVANVMTNLTLQIEGQDITVSQIEGQDIPISEGFRLGEGPFDFEVVEGNALESGLAPGDYTDAFADGYYLGIDTSLLPSLPDGIDVDSGGIFQLGSLPEVDDDNPLKGTYDGFRAVGDLPITQTYNFKFDLNEVPGTNKDDNLTGTGERDKIEAGNGKDNLTGGGGNDYLNGGNGKDVLNGTGLDADGFGEIDVLDGGNGKDTYVLGDGTNTYYVGGGNSDYALILNYQKNEVLQLGSADYDVRGGDTFGGQSGASIYDGDDLVAFLVGVSSSDVVI